MLPVVVTARADNGRVTARHDFSSHRRETVDDYYLGVHGTRLRHAALAVLMSVGSCSITEMWTYLKGRHRLDESVTKKSLANALRYECAKGRAVRIGYATYHVGEIAPRTRRRIIAEEREIGVELTRGEYETHLLGNEERRLLEHLRVQRLLAAHEGETAPLPDAVDVLQADCGKPP